MKKINFQNSAIVTALLASLCCITPVLAVLGGITGIASSFEFLEPLRPYFIGLTAIVLGFAFYQNYKPKKENEIACECEENEKSSSIQNFLNTKKFLWIVTIVSVILISFPYYSQIFFPELNNNSITTSSRISHATVHIEGMTCTSCEHSVNYALKSIKGVHKVSSDYKTGLARIEYDPDNVTDKEIKKAIEEKVGYKVIRIEKQKKM